MSTSALRTFVLGLAPASLLLGASLGSGCATGNDSLDFGGGTSSDGGATGIGGATSTSNNVGPGTTSSTSNGGPSTTSTTGPTTSSTTGPGPTTSSTTGPSTNVSTTTGGNCLPSEYTCSDGSCIPGTWECDGLPDCPFAEDETNCGGGGGNCLPSEYTCSDGSCIPGTWVCDGIDDCFPLAEDEMNCGGQGTCDAVGICGGDGINSGCTDCVVVGTAADATDGGTCKDEYVACYGDPFDYVNCVGGNVDCCAFDACVNACDTNQNGTLEAGAELNCLCPNNGTSCTNLTTVGTCTGDHQTGVNLEIAYLNCRDAACPTSCP